MRNSPRTPADGARENAKAAGLKIVYDRSYPPATTDYAPIVRAIQAANPDIVFVGSYPLDSVGHGRARSANSASSRSMSAAAWLACRQRPSRPSLDRC